MPPQHLVPYAQRVMHVVGAAALMLTVESGNSSHWGIHCLRVAQKLFTGIGQGYQVTFRFDILGHLADALDQSDLQYFMNTFIHWWWWLICEVPTSTPRAVSEKLKLLA